jgi:hypothetical protein
VVNLVMYVKGVWCSEKFLDPKMVHWPKLGGGGGSPKLICSTNNFFGTGRAQSEKVGQISFRPPNFFLPVHPCEWFHKK